MNDATEKPNDQILLCRALGIETENLFEAVITIDHHGIRAVCKYNLQPLRVVAGEVAYETRVLDVIHA